jgi:hypothetical protein
MPEDNNNLLFPEGAIRFTQTAAAQTEELAYPTNKDIMDKLNNIEELLRAILLNKSEGTYITSYF